MPISPTNISKNIISPTGLGKTNAYFFLLREDGSYLLREEGGRIIIRDNSLFPSPLNLTKNSASPINLSKS